MMHRLGTTVAGAYRLEKERALRISVFGLGYVGTVSAGCLARHGHQVIGVDPIKTKVELINSGQSPIIEAEIGEIISAAVLRGNLRATDDSADAVLSTDVSIICVGTPSQPNGNLDLRFVRGVCEQIGSALKMKKNWHVVAVRSTVLPGTVRKIVIPMLEETSGKRAGKEFGVCHNPEFLREGSAVHDFDFPPKTVIGETDSCSGETVAALYSVLNAPLVRTELEISEMIKYVDNCWHALKIGFANEIGNLCKALGVDSHRVVDIFCQDRKLNISPAYLMPGFAFGGSCLPKDLRALAYHARAHDIETPIISSILPSNDMQVRRGIDLVMKSGHKRIGILGFSFKAGTDDLRESPLIELIERLIGKGYNLRLYDKNVRLASLTGSNRDFILNRIPHISQLMVDSVSQLLTHAQTIVIGNNDPEFRQIPAQVCDGQVVVDFVRIADLCTEEGKYEGICW
jgi:GDP-mannose 6-dehydrogenase